jgi:hypothetical protein
MSGSRKRTYLGHVPGKYTGTAGAVVFDFHGYSSSGKGQMGSSGFRKIADREGFLAVYPEGVGASWNVNGCCGTAGQGDARQAAWKMFQKHSRRARACSLTGCVAEVRGTRHQPGLIASESL